MTASSAAAPDVSTRNPRLKSRRLPTARRSRLAGGHQADSLAG